MPGIHSSNKIPINDCHRKMSSINQSFLFCAHMNGNVKKCNYVSGIV